MTESYQKYTLQHQNDTMTDDDWDNVDKSHRQTAYQLFKQLGATQIVFSTGNCCYDISFNFNGKRIVCELKDREQRAKNYNDVMIEKIKYDSLARRLANGEFDRALAMNHYPDGTIRLANIFKSKHTQRKMRCPNTSYVKGCQFEYVWKDCILLQDFNERQM